MSEKCSDVFLVYPKEEGTWFTSPVKIFSKREDALVWTSKQKEKYLFQKTANKLWHSATEDITDKFCWDRIDKQNKITKKTFDFVYGSKEMFNYVVEIILEKKLVPDIYHKVIVDIRLFKRQKINTNPMLFEKWSIVKRKLI